MDRTNHITRVFLFSLLVTSLYVTSLYSYLLFHTLVEVFTVIVMSSIFFLAWNTRNWMEDNFFLFIGIAFLFIGFIELIHTLAYKGMNVFPGYDANLPTQLWILARYILSLSMLIAPIWLKKRLPLWPALAGYLTLTVFFLWLVFTGNFPDSYIEGTGLTNFKITSEYLIILFFLCSIILLFVNKAAFEPHVLSALFWFLFLSVIAEAAFTTYLGVYDSANMIGHLVMLVSFLILYEALIRTGLQHPFDLVFRDLKLKEAALTRSEADLQRLFDISPLPVLITSRSDSRFLKVNQAALDIFELTSEELHQYKGLDFYANPEDRARLLDKLSSEGKIKNELVELKTRSGKHVWCLVNSVPTELDGEPALLVGMADISEQKRIQEELRYLSTHDALTGVYNRTYFEAEVERLQRGRRFPVSVIMLDTDDLKNINDTYGHARGDELLQKVASLIKGILRGDEVFARIGGDEFAILLPRAETHETLPVVSRIKEQVSQYNSENGHMPIKISIGIGVAGEKEDLNDALKRADANMYADKNVRKGNTRPLKPQQ